MVDLLALANEVARAENKQHASRVTLFLTVAERNAIVKALRAAPVAQPVARRLLESDAYCPCCGHNRNRSSVSTIDVGNGIKTCQMCGTSWNEFDAAPVAPSEDVGQKLSADDVQWVTNSIAELGVKIGEQFFFLYKGHSLVYSNESDSEPPLYWRPVWKREFGECVHPLNHSDFSKYGTVDLNDSDEWKRLPLVDAARGKP